MLVPSDVSARAGGPQARPTSRMLKQPARPLSRPNRPPREEEQRVVIIRGGKGRYDNYEEASGEEQAEGDIEQQLGQQELHSGGSLHQDEEPGPSDAAAPLSASGYHQPGAVVLTSATVAPASLVPHLQLSGILPRPSSAMTAVAARLRQEPSFGVGGRPLLGFGGVSTATTEFHHVTDAAKLTSIDEHSQQQQRTSAALPRSSSVLEEATGLGCIGGALPRMASIKKPRDAQPEGVVPLKPVGGTAARPTKAAAVVAPVPDAGGMQSRDRPLISTAPLKARATPRSRYAGIQEQLRGMKPHTKANTAAEGG